MADRSRLAALHHPGALRCVYFGHFKTNLRRIEDYPQLSDYLRDLYQVPGVAETVDFNQIQTHYYGSHGTINPNGIIPKGPELDYCRPHDRDRLTTMPANNKGA